MAKDELDLLSNEFMAAVAQASLHRGTAETLANRIDENLRKYPDLNPEKRKAFERTRDWLRTCA
jgi:hypothetical protein